MMRRRHSLPQSPLSMPQPLVSLPLSLSVCHSLPQCHTPFTHRTVITRPTTTAAMVGHQVEKGSALSNRSSKRSMLCLCVRLCVCVCNFKTVTIRALIDARIRMSNENLRLLCTAHDLGLNCNRNNKYKFSLRAPTARAASSLPSPTSSLSFSALHTRISMATIEFKWLPRSVPFRSVPAYFQFT